MAPMRYRLRTLLIVVTVGCLFLGWTRLMSDYHRREAWKAERRIGELSTARKKEKDWDRDWRDSHRLFRRHLKRSNDFDHAVLPPWLIVLGCPPGSFFGAPAYMEPQPRIIPTSPPNVSPPARFNDP